MSKFTKLVAAAASVLLLGSLTACSSGTPEATGTNETGGGTGAAGQIEGYNGETIKIGVVGASEPYWQTYTDAVKAEGINVELVDYADYNQPNPATSAGDVDINQFQHVLYLAKYNVEAGDDLVPIGSTAIYPLGLYSTKHDSVEAIPAGGTVGVPNDLTNQARGLLVLQSAGLITLKDGGTAFSTLQDIDEAASKVKVQELGADLLANSLTDFDAAIINNDFVTDAGLTPADALAQDDPNDPAALAYVNIFATTKDKADTPVFQELIRIYQETPAVQEAVLEAAGGSALLLKTPAADLQGQLEKIESDLKQQ